MTANIDTMSGCSYTIYIQATPEEVWRGLTDPDLTNRYWRHHRAGPKTFRSNWTQGSTYDLVHEEVGLVVSDPQQVILESDPYRRLAYTWHTFTPAWAAQVGMDETTADIWRAEPRSKVAFDIEDARQGVVGLTVLHDGFGPGSNVLEAISQGWPAVSNVRSGRCRSRVTRWRVPPREAEPAASSARKPASSSSSLRAVRRVSEWRIFTVQARTSWADHAGSGQASTARSENWAGLNVSSISAMEGNRAMARSAPGK
jgi:uncharacterized protein YndB with AHSA1/START domain